MDLALEVADEDGSVRYFAVEIAFYAEQKGINRALTSARLLARFTGRPSYAVIAVGRDYRGLPQTVLNGDYPILIDTPDSEQVYLYQLNERNIERAMADRRYEQMQWGLKRSETALNYDGETSISCCRGNAVPSPPHRTP